jgi:RNA polymerase sigma-70 factor (ECF subfamily)
VAASLIPMATRQQEFEQIAMPHSRSLLRVARRLTSEPAAAEDLVQETMLLAWRGFWQFRAGTNVRAWLFRILFNAFHARGRKIRATPAMVPLTALGSFRSGTDFLDLARALGELAQEHRTVLLLGVVEGFTCREMAEILSVPIGTVMSRLSRAREALRTRLAPGIRYAGKGA